ncbi:MAG TPA: hypothetical protein VGI05_18425 [Streptosporangiaceae bacterium]
MTTMVVQPRDTVAGHTPATAATWRMVVGIVTFPFLPLAVRRPGCH